MATLLSRSQASDFIRLEGLQKLTSNRAYDWDLYILKELVDNALDADEADPQVGQPNLHIVMSYITDKTDATGRIERGLSISVTNKAAFPLNRVGDLFDLEQRYSVKDYYTYPTRGAYNQLLQVTGGTARADYQRACAVSQSSKAA